MSNCSRTFARTGTLFRPSQARAAAIPTSGIQKKAAFWSQIDLPLSVGWAAPIIANPMIQGVMNWTALTPKLPIPAWMPSAVPWSRFGKKRLGEGMNEEKVAPPRAPREEGPGGGKKGGELPPPGARQECEHEEEPVRSAVVLYGEEPAEERPEQEE